ncbi:MAG: hypothetical protein GY778_16485 [bacterium]|nr:hypothetical protein [bacterium]
MNRKRPDNKPSSRVGRYWIHVLLVGVVVAECLTTVALHRSEQELRQAFETGDARQKVYALHILANRDEPTISDPEFTRRLTNSHEALVRELTVTRNFSRNHTGEEQREYMASLADPGEFIRCRVIMGGKVGEAGYVTPHRLRRFYGTLAD